MLIAGEINRSNLHFRVTQLFGDMSGVLAIRYKSLSTCSGINSVSKQC